MEPSAGESGVKRDSNGIFTVFSARKGYDFRPSSVFTFKEAIFSGYQPSRDVKPEAEVLVSFAAEEFIGFLTTLKVFSGHSFLLQLTS